MDERHDDEQGHSAGDNEPGAGKASPTVGAGDTLASAENGAGHGLPIIASPQLGGGEAVEEPAVEHGRGDHDAHVKSIAALPVLIREPVHEASRADVAGPGPQTRSFRFALLAATIACAAGVGALAGSLTASGIGQHHAVHAAVPRTAESREVVQALKSQRAEINALKGSLENENRSANAQFANISNRLNGLERSQADAASKFTHMADAVDRLGRKTAAAAPEITGSIAASPPPAAAAAAAKVDVATPVLHDWIVQEVRNGRAMIESRYGSLFLVGSGSVLPGLGRIQDVRRQDGEWIVVTEKGLITSRP